MNLAAEQIGEVPKVADVARSWPEVFFAAALQGEIFALVKAALDRSAAAGTRKLTGTWPGEDSDRSDEDSQQAAEPVR